MSDASTNATSRERTDRDLRWPRLFAGFLWNVVWFGLGSFVAECVWYLWKYNLVLNGLTVSSVVLSLANALGFGVFCGFFIGFATWLSRELFGGTKPSPLNGWGTTNRWTRAAGACFAS
jgi:hypothetical protein